MGANVLQSQGVLLHHFASLEIVVVSRRGHMLKIRIQLRGELMHNFLEGQIASVFLQDLAARSCEIPILENIRRLQDDRLSYLKFVGSWSLPQVVYEPLNLRVKYGRLPPLFFRPLIHFIFLKFEFITF